MASSQAAIEKSLATYRKAPLIPLELPAIAELLADPNVAASAFKPFLRRDPILCASLVHQGYLATRNRNSHPYAADHALTVIGLGGLQAVVDRFAQHKRQDLSEEVRFYLTANLLAAEIGLRLTNDEQMYWHCLFYGTPDTMMWQLHPRAMWHIIYRRAWRPRNLRLFEETKLGFNLLEWRKAVSKRWHLDEKAERIFATPIPNSPKTLLEYIASDFHRTELATNDWRDSEGLKVVACNFLARAILNPWFRNAEFHYYSLLARAFHKDFKSIKKLVTEAVLTVSDELNDSILFRPAVCWLMQPSPPRYPQWLVKPTINASVAAKLRPSRHQKPKATGKTKSSPASKHAPANQSNVNSKAKPIAPQSVAPQTTRTTANYDLSIASQLLKKLSTESQSFPTNGWMLQEFLDAMIKGLGFQYATYLQMDYQNKQAVGKLVAVAPGTEKRKFDIDFSTPTPLLKFVSAETAALLSKTKHGKIWPRLPKTILERSVGRFYLASIAAKKRVSILVYMDCGAETIADEQRWQRAKKLTRALATAIKQRASQQ